MKKVLFTALAVSVALAPAMAQDVSVNVNSAEAPELTTVPTIDGDLSDWADIPVFGVTMNMDGDSPAAEDGSGDLDITLKVAWDDETNALYLGINVIDDALMLLHGALPSGSEWDGSGWRNERLEIVIDGENTGDPASNNGSGFHQQYTFDMPPSLLPLEEGGILDLPVSEDFQSVRVFETMQGGLNNPGDPWNYTDDFVHSAAQLRALDANQSIPVESEPWTERAVEYNWEIKLVVFDFLLTSDQTGHDAADAANIADGHLAYWSDGLHDVKDLEEGQVIGFSPQQNDGDLFDTPVAREHQTNTTNVAGNWNSSESLTGLILGANIANGGGGSSIADWSIR